MEEATEREGLMRRLHQIESRITDHINKIRNELKETVTFKGMPYLLKMKTDFLDIFKRIKLMRENPELYKNSYVKVIDEKLLAAERLRRKEDEERTRQVQRQLSALRRRNLKENV